MASSLPGRTYPCARCFKVVSGVIRQKDYDRDETPNSIGVKMRRADAGGIREVVCAKCLRDDYAERISPAKKVIAQAQAPAKSVMSTALRSDGGDEGDDDEDEEVVVVIPKTSGLLTASKPTKKKSEKKAETEKAQNPVQTSAPKPKKQRDA